MAINFGMLGFGDSGEKLGDDVRFRGMGAREARKVVVVKLDLF